MENKAIDYYEACCLRYQRALYMGFLTAAALLALVLQSSNGSGEITIPLIGVVIENLVAAVIFVLAFHVGSGVMALIASNNLRMLRKYIGPDQAKILSLFPSITTAGHTIRICAIFSLYVIFVITLMVAEPGTSLCKAILGGAIYPIFFISSLLPFFLHNKGFNRTPESSGPAKPGESSGGAG